MAITTPLMIEILQHFARVFPMLGRIDGREDYLALLKTWSDQLEPYSDDQVKGACRRLMGKLKRFPYPSDVREELGATALTSNIAGTMEVVLAVNTIQIDAALAKAAELRAALEDLGKAEFRHADNSIASELLKEVRDLRAQIAQAVIAPAPLLAARYGARPE